jgi:hypothetical protein
MGAVMFIIGYGSRAGMPSVFALCTNAVFCRQDSLTGESGTVSPGGALLHYNGSHEGVRQTMSGHRVLYSRGSFSFAIACATREQALARALSISREAGVWHVQMEDPNGKRFVFMGNGAALASAGLRLCAERLPAQPVACSRRDSEGG